VINEDQTLQWPSNRSLELAIGCSKMVIALKRRVLCISARFIYLFKLAMDVVVDALPTCTIYVHLFMHVSSYNLTTILVICA